MSPASFPPASSPLHAGAKALLTNGNVTWTPSPGRVRAKVNDAHPAAVQLDAPRLSSETLVDVLRAHPLWVGALLDGIVPQPMRPLLLPSQPDAFTPHCSLPQDKGWCVHALAVWLAVSQANPEALLLWRGVNLTETIEVIWPSAAPDPQAFWQGAPLPRPLPAASLPVLPRPLGNTAQAEATLQHAIQDIQHMAHALMKWRDP